MGVHKYLRVRHRLKMVNKAWIFSTTKNILIDVRKFNIEKAKIDETYKPNPNLCREDCLDLKCRVCITEEQLQGMKEKVKRLWDKRNRMIIYILNNMKKDTPIAWK